MGFFGRWGKTTCKECGQTFIGLFSADGRDSSVCKHCMADWPEDGEPWTEEQLLAWQVKKTAGRCRVSESEVFWTKQKLKNGFTADFFLNKKPEPPLTELQENHLEEKPLEELADKEDDDEDYEHYDYSQWDICKICRWPRGDHTTKNLGHSPDC